jgi:hypothetical protein
MFGWNPKWKPIRLLELDYTVGPSKVRLQAQFSPADLLYMTLSHGWGSSSSQRLILTRDTLGALREESRSKPYRKPSGMLSDSHGGWVDGIYEQIACVFSRTTTTTGDTKHR